MTFNENIIVTGKLNEDKNMKFKEDKYPLCNEPISVLANHNKQVFTEIFAAFGIQY